MGGDARHLILFSESKVVYVGDGIVCSCVKLAQRFQLNVMGMVGGGLARGLKGFAEGYYTNSIYS